ncbi:uncharacterized protein JN550_002812 [Neoarthrinium moseri]|uniref:uncharacterized protein n=1 Tax=Neoarthrinium moseri TaxID=1658444 RepID=UPI001FDE59A7|nr:uncharacterized protein JN550_002812 [Neoarthrinium moseri]KAI1874233.1 hypothetical protein JN550_002812 [Neoarthrinium moseri]
MSQNNFPALGSNPGELERQVKSEPAWNEQSAKIPQQGYGIEAQAQMPFPSQVVSSTRPMELPPSQLLSETFPAVDPTFSGLAGIPDSFQPSAFDPTVFVQKANELINASLERTPGGTSVVEPDSILEESGRLYHGYNQGKYFLPNDAAEQDRLDLQHQVYRILLDGWLHLAPMTTVPNFVLDVATGTGIWAHDFDPRVPNCVFQKDDADAEWVFPAPHPPGTQCDFPCEHRIKFDFVHLRMVVTCFDDPRAVMRQAYNNMAPGGWIEYQDFSFDLQARGLEGSPWQTYSEGCIRGAKTMGRDLLIPKQYKTYLEEVGFVDVEKRHLVLPNNPWPKDRRLRKAGLYSLQNTLEGLRGVGYKMLRFAGYSPEETETIISEAGDFIRDCRNQPWVPVHIVYGRKPLV